MTQQTITDITIGTGKDLPKQFIHDVGGSRTIVVSGCACLVGGLCDVGNSVVTLCVVVLNSPAPRSSRPQ